MRYPDCVDLVKVAELPIGELLGPSGFYDEQGDPVSTMQLYAYAELVEHGADGVFADPSGTRLSRDAINHNRALNADKCAYGINYGATVVALVSRRPNEITSTVMAEFQANTGQTQAA